MRKRACAFLAGFLVSIATGHGGTAETLNLKDWLSRTLPFHPALKAAEAELQARSMRAGQRISWEDPELRLQQDERQGSRDEFSVTLRFPLPSPVVERALGRSEDARLEVARAEKEAAIRLAREDLGILYLEAAAAGKLTMLSRDHLKAVEIEVKRARELLDRKRITRTEFLEIRIDAADAVVEFSAQKNRESTLKSRMAEHLPGIPEGSPLNLEFPEFVLDRDPPTFAALRKQILSRDPELAARIAEIRVATAAVAAERARRIPFPTFIEGGWTYDRSRDQDEWEVQVGISLPLFTWTRGTDPRQRAEQILAETNEQIRRDELIALAGRLLTQFAETRSRLERLRGTVEPVLQDIEETLESEGRVIRPEDRLNLIDGRYRLRRDLERTRLALYLSAWSLHTMVWNWQEPF